MKHKHKGQASRHNPKHKFQNSGKGKLPPRRKSHYGN